PSASQIGVLWNPKIKSHQLSLKEIKNTAANMGLSIIPLDAQNQGDIDRAFETMSSEKPDALINFGDTLFTANRTQIADYAITNKIPTNFNHAGFVGSGILMSYGPDPVRLFARLGNYVGKILDGAKPSDLPVERPSEFDLVVNLETAEKINLTLPPEFLLQATKVIQ
ncbi:MAG: ABC transporter substrate-binding protein, partial [Deltaproteobacteria bacterium]|nr:ABC transporter substrate-binding protein [Deltaproteobacteria bacterium]